MGTQQSFIFDSQNNDRLIDSSDLATLFHRLSTDGIVNDSDLELEVRQRLTPSFSIRVMQGSAFVRGRFFRLFDNPQILAVDTSVNRIDRIVVRMDMDERKVSLAVKQGTSSAPPSLTRNSTIWELSLAQINVIQNQNIVSGQITDERFDSSLCGISTHPSFGSEGAGGFLSLDGGTMNGDIDMDQNQIKRVQRLFFHDRSGDGDVFGFTEDGSEGTLILNRYNASTFASTGLLWRVFDDGSLRFTQGGALLEVDNIETKNIESESIQSDFYESYGSNSTLMVLGIRDGGTTDRRTWGFRTIDPRTLEIALLEDDGTFTDSLLQFSTDAISDKTRVSSRADTTIISPEADASQSFIFDDRGEGSGGSEPTMRPTATNFGFLGTSDRRFWRVFADVVSATSFAEVSSEKGKENISNYDIKKSYDLIEGLKVKEFDRKADENGKGAVHHVGFISEYTDDRITNDKKTTIYVSQLVNHLTGAVQVLQDKVKKIENNGE